MITRRTIQLAARRAIVGGTLVAALVAAPGHRGPHDVAAEGNDPTTNATIEIQVCEAMGGHANVWVYRTANGALIVYVECVGGAMNGYWCENDAAFTNCGFTRLEANSDPDPVHVNPVNTGPDRPAQPGIIPGQVSVDVGPAREEATALPTAEATADSGQDQVPVHTVDSDGGADLDPGTTPSAPDGQPVDGSPDEGGVPSRSDDQPDKAAPDATPADNAPSVGPDNTLPTLDNLPSR